MLPPLEVGQSIEVSGAVTLFDATPQLSLRRSADIQPLGERVAFAKFTPLIDLTIHMQGAGCVWKARLKKSRLSRRA